MITSACWRHKTPLLALVLAVLHASARAGVIHVPADQLTIQAAIVAAADHDTILVEPGTYPEAVDLIHKNLRLVGVGGAAVTRIDASGLHASALTIRDGTAPGALVRGFTITGGVGQILGGGKLQIGGGGGVLLLSGPDGTGATATIRDCVITHNDAGHAFYALGGGVLVTSGSSAVLIGCELSHNDAYAGGGAYIDPGDGLALALHGCSITGNSAIYSGGVEGGIVQHSLIAGNTAEATGGGLGQVVAAMDCLVRDNFAGNCGGGAAYVGELTSCSFARNVHGGVAHADTAHDCLFENNAGGGATDISVVDGCIFRGNRTFGFSSSVTHTVTRCSFIRNVGAGLSLTVSGPITVADCFFAHNAGPFGGGCQVATRGTPPEPPRILFCSFQGDTVECQQPVLMSHCILRDPRTLLPFLDLSWSDVEGGAAGPGNIDADPLYVDAARGDLHLLPGSPCIDAGDPAFVPLLDETDIDGDPRQLGPFVDIGADEVQP